MGKKGRQSRRGVGEFDPEPRNASLWFKVTQQDYLLLCAAAKKQNRTKVDILIELSRKNLSKSAKYIASLEDETLF
ncbi:hypothetical protein [Microseira wollei]|uniref:Uncharacterized protein n=1 Tax=Microseira wollei NIES-4236 TaxID=2530354 RepID=A0AAV3XPD5_9CYAN|nr:hypothetical protein [Microseira wollei]GET43005.1 hypothetical protein MiSe_78250 [Microseira wollei NIES-4236]